jgi:hypothetical protein
MQSSHNTIEPTVSVLQNFPLHIGETIIYLQVQVSENLPCNFILGLSFFTLTSAQIDFSTNGDVHLVMTDPNTGKELRIPTHERETKVEKPVSFTGF